MDRPMDSTSSDPGFISSPIPSPVAKTLDQLLDDVEKEWGSPPTFSNPQLYGVDIHQLAQPQGTPTKNHMSTSASDFESSLPNGTFQYTFQAIPQKTRINVMSDMSNSSPRVVARIPVPYDPTSANTTRASASTATNSIIANIPPKFIRTKPKESKGVVPSLKNKTFKSPALPAFSFFPNTIAGSTGVPKSTEMRIPSFNYNKFGAMTKPTMDNLNRNPGAVGPVIDDSGIPSYPPNKPRMQSKSLKTMPLKIHSGIQGVASTMPAPSKKQKMERATAGSKKSFPPIPTPSVPPESAICAHAKTPVSQKKKSDPKCVSLKVSLAQKSDSPTSTSPTTIPTVNPEMPLSLNQAQEVPCCSSLNPHSVPYTDPLPTLATNQEHLLTPERTTNFSEKLDIFRTDLDVLFRNWFPQKGSRSNRRGKMLPYDSNQIPELIELSVDNDSVMKVLLDCATPFLANGRTSFEKQLVNIRPLLMQACVSLKLRYAMVTYLVEWFQKTFCQSESYSNPGMLKLMEFFIKESKIDKTGSDHKNAGFVSDRLTMRPSDETAAERPNTAGLLLKRELALWYHAHLLRHVSPGDSILPPDNVNLSYMADCYSFFTRLHNDCELEDPLNHAVERAEERMPLDAPLHSKYILSYLLDCRSPGMALEGTFQVDAIMQMVNPEISGSQYLCSTAFPVAQNNLNSRKTVRLFDERCAKGVSWYRCAYTEFGRRSPNICVVPSQFDVGLPPELRISPAFDIGTFYCGHCSDEAVAKITLKEPVPSKFTYTFTDPRAFDDHCAAVHVHVPKRYALPCGCERIYGVAMGEHHRLVCLKCTCGKKFSTPEEKRHHCEAEANTKGGLGCHYCSFCDLFFVDAAALLEHLETYCSDCPSCGKVFPYHTHKKEANRLKHRKKHLSTCFHCSYCDREHHNQKKLDKCPRKCLKRSLHPDVFLTSA